MVVSGRSGRGVSEQVSSAHLNATIRTGRDVNRTGAAHGILLVDTVINSQMVFKTWKNQESLNELQG